MLDQSRQDELLNVVTTEVYQIAATLDSVFYRMEAHMQQAHITMRPKVFPDGNKWCALYGDNIMEGVAGFGSTPEEAMLDFTASWEKQKLPTKFKYSLVKDQE